MNWPRHSIEASGFSGAGTFSEANRYVKITDGFRLVIWLALTLYMLLVIYFGLTSSAVAPYLILRLLAVTAFVVVSTMPLWYPGISEGIFSPLFVLSAYLFFKKTLPNAQSFAEGISSHGAIPSASPATIALLHIFILCMQALSWLMIIAGYRYTRGISWSRIQFHETRAIFLYAGLFCTSIGFLSIFFLIDLSGGLDLHLKNITVGKSARVYAKDATFASMYAVLSKLSLIGPAIWVLRGTKPFRSPIFWFVAIAAVGSGFLVSGRRTELFLRAILLVGCWLLKRRSVALGRMAIIGLLLFLTIGIVGEFRRSNWKKRRRIDYSAITSFELADALENSAGELERRREGGAIYPIVYRVPAEVSFLYGKNYLDYINRFIPRIIWKNKPRGIGIDCARVFFGRVDAGGIPPGEIGEAYWSGGIVAVVIVFFLWGMILRSIGNFFAVHGHSPFACLLYLATMTTLGPSETAFRSWLYMTVPTVVCLWMFGVISSISAFQRVTDSALNSH